MAVRRGSWVGLGSMSQVTCPVCRSSWPVAQIQGTSGRCPQCGGSIPPPGHRLAKPATPPKPKTSPIAMVGGGFVGLCVIAVIITWSMERSKESNYDQPPLPPANTAPAPSTSPPPPEKPKEEITPATIIKNVAAYDTFDEALSVALGFMEEERNSDSIGAVLLAAWGAKKMRWSDVFVAKDEVSYAAVKKDSDTAKGKRLCHTGRIVEIKKDAIGEYGPIWVGQMMLSRARVLRFLAVGSSGDLVERSRARICGVVTGLFTYDNAVGGTSHAVAVVGMFRLPENVKAE